MIELLFWILLAVVFYAYIGYPLLMWGLLKVKGDQGVLIEEHQILPTVTLFVAAFNESAYVHDKIKNTLALDYPKDKMRIVWVTDGSDDNTNELLAGYPAVEVHFKPERNGKIHAMNRGMSMVKTDLVIFSDGNTLLGKDTVKEIVAKFQDSKVACVAGEKRIELHDKDAAASAGEGFYWKYESWLKELDGKLGSCIGAAGELFAIRTALYSPVRKDAILDDFMISMQLAMKGYKVAYSSKAYAIEKGSADVSEEMKRKVRIAAGSIQTLVWLLPLLNIFKYKFLSFQYISHKVSRWVLVPVALVLVFALNFWIVFNMNPLNPMVYQVLLVLQLLFYSTVIFGALLQNRSIKWRILFVPYYFFMGNWAMWLGLKRYLSGKQTVKWERAKRAE